MDAAYNCVVFRGRAEILFVVCRRVGHWTRWLEGCYCHEHLLISCSSWEERRKVLEENGVDGGVACIFLVRACVYMCLLLCLLNSIPDLRMSHPLALCGRTRTWCFLCFLFFCLRRRRSSLATVWSYERFKLCIFRDVIKRHASLRRRFC